MTGDRLKKLEAGFLEGSLNEAEERELKAFIQKHPEHHLNAYFSWTSDTDTIDLPNFKEKVRLEEPKRAFGWAKIAAAIVFLFAAAFLLKDSLIQTTKQKEYTEAEIDECYKATIETLSSMASFIDKSLSDTQEAMDLLKPFEKLNELKDQNSK